MNIYLASRLSQRKDLGTYVRALKALEYNVTNKITDSDIVISSAESETDFYDVEFAWGYRNGKVTYLVGPYENVNEWLYKGVIWFDTWLDLFSHLEEVAVFYKSKETMRSLPSLPARQEYAYAQ